MTATEEAGLRLLQEQQIGVEVTSAADVVLRVPGQPVRVVQVKMSTSSPTPSRVRLDQLTRLQRAPGERADGVLYLLPRVSASLRRTAEEDVGVDVVGVDQDLAIIAGQVFEPSGVLPAARPARRRRPWVGWALLRVLVRTPTPRTQQELAVECGGTQAAVSQSLRTLGDAVRRGADGWAAVDPTDLWDRFVADYRGPAGLSTYWYGLDDSRTQTDRVRRLADRQQVQVRLSGDVAADWWAPWRRPGLALLYARRGVDLASGPFAEASPAVATVRLVVPADRTIWSTAAAWSAGGERLALADPLITAWDLLDTGGADAQDAALELRDRVLRGSW